MTMKFKSFCIDSSVHRLRKGKQNALQLSGNGLQFNQTVIFGFDLLDQLVLIEKLF